MKRRLEEDEHGVVHVLWNGYPVCDVQVMTYGTRAYEFATCLRCEVETARWEAPDVAERQMGGVSSGPHVTTPIIDIRMWEVY